MPVDAVVVSADIVYQCILDLYAGYHLFVVVTFHKFYEIPFRAEIHVGKFFRHISQRRYYPVLEVGEPLEYHPVAYVVIEDRKLI